MESSWERDIWFVLAAEVAIGDNPVNQLQCRHMINLYNSSKLSFVDLIDSSLSKSDLNEGTLSWF